MNRILKITDGSKTKRTEYPISYSNLVDFVSSWIPINPDQYFTFKDIKTNQIISNDIEYQQFKINHPAETPKILVIIKTKSQSVNNINEININEQPNPQYVISKEQQKIESNMNEDIKQKEIQSDDFEEQFKQSIMSIVQGRLKNLEQEMIKEITNKVTFSSQSKILNSQMSKIDNQVVHKGIKCSNCGMEDIKGIRYKCSVCDNFNLCEQCERQSKHDVNHIFIKMRVPFDENLIPKKNFSYVVEGYAFDYSPKIYNGFSFEKLQTQIKLINTGTSNWLPGFAFKCLERESDIVGTAPTIQTKIAPGKDCYIEVTFYNGKKKGFFKSYWQMYTPKGIPFGEPVKFEFNLQ